MNFDARQKVILVRIELKGGKRIGLTTKSKKNERILYMLLKRNVVGDEGFGKYHTILYVHITISHSMG